MREVNTADEWGLTRGMLTLSVTDRCNARCAHCLAESGPDEEAALTAADILDVYRQARDQMDINVVVFTGGEPTTLADELFDAIAEISLDGVLTRVVTNACWAEDDESARAMIQRFREAGLDEINFSMDDYHAVWVPPENVGRAYRAARAMGFSAVVLAVAEGPRSRVGTAWIKENIDPDITVLHQELNTATGAVLPAADGTVYELSSHGYTRVGRARRMRDDLVIPEPLLSTQHFRCAEVMDALVVDGNGDVGACCGIRFRGNPVLTLGNVRKSRLVSSIHKGRSRLLLRALNVLGPKYLLDLAISVDPGLAPRPFYCHICEICEDVTSYPRALAALAIVEDRIRSDVVTHLTNIQAMDQSMAKPPVEV